MTVPKIKESKCQPTAISRRDFVRNCSLGALALASAPILGCQSAGSKKTSGPGSWTASLDQDWLFGGKFSVGADQPAFNDHAFPRVTLPHCVSKLSWENWEPKDWQSVWIYRRHFHVQREFRHRRIFVDFDRAMTKASPSINGHALPEHLGGYLPFSYEITEFLNAGDNVLAVKVDSTWQKIPPDGNPKGVTSVDYLQPGGIPGSVTLRAMPQVFISDVFAKPVKVLQPDRSVEITGMLDSALYSENSFTVRVEMLDGNEPIAAATTTVTANPGKIEFALTLSNLGNVKLWDVDNPHLYTIRTTLLADDKPLHDHHTRIGLREARFDVDGFFLNGKRLRLFGLNRHEIYPYVGLAMPDRVMRRDAEILKHEFNCNIVRCSHYPQSEAFLDACDELGLMVWEEPPGWGYLSEDPAWQELVVQNVTDMVLRDRNHAAIVIWGVRVNESRNDVPLYKRTTAIAKKLDGTRACSGSMTGGSRKNWKKEWVEDVFAMDDYHSAKDGSVGIDAPLPGVPYMLAETVGQFSYGLEKKGFANIYRRAGNLDVQTKQALFHAEAHNKAASYPRFCGVIAWCAFEYASLVKPFNAIKCPGVADVFRIPKLGASFYLAQVSPKIRPVIEPSFYWDFGPNSPHGPGKLAAIFSNCDRLEIFVAGKSIATAQPDRKSFPYLAYPPFFCDLEVSAADKPELRIDGYVDNKLALSKSFSSDTSQDQLLLSADDTKLIADGADATRLVFKIADKFGNQRAFALGDVVFDLKGPGVLVGDNPFSFTDSGGAGAVWVKTVPVGKDRIIVKARHATLGEKKLAIEVS